jgi:hypothetical protein
LRLKQHECRKEKNLRRLAIFPRDKVFFFFRAGLDSGGGFGYLNAVRISNVSPPLLARFVDAIAKDRSLADRPPSQQGVARRQ